MSEKRFTANGRWIAEGTIVDICDDNGKVIMQVFDNDNIQNIVNLLNELNDESRKLKEENDQLRQELQGMDELLQSYEKTIKHICKTLC